MHRFGCLVFIGALAVAVCVVAAGPAVAAKGGNNDTAKACQHGMVDESFKNQGDCVNDGAQAIPPPILRFDSGRPTCDDIGGVFMAGSNQWICVYDERTNTARGGIDTHDLRVACRDDNGLFVTNTLPPSSLQGICSART